MKVKNVSPLGDLAVPALGLSVLAGDVIDVSEADGASLLEQPENWAPADGKPGKKSDPIDVPADPAA